MNRFEFTLNFGLEKTIKALNTYMKLKKEITESANLPEFNSVLKGIQKGRYYLIGAESGAGKTTFADFLILTIWLYASDGIVLIC